MSYKIYLDREETFECEASIKNSSYKNAKSRLIIESNDVNLVFYGTIDKDTISVPIKNLSKYFTEKDSAKIKLEVIVENQLVTPWESDIEFDTYNKVEIKEIKNASKTEPLIEVKVKEDKKQIEKPVSNQQVKKEPLDENNLKEEILKTVNEHIKNTKLGKKEKKELIKNLLKKNL